MATACLAPAAPAADPDADFTATPAVPTAGERATYQAVLSERYRKGTVQWDFNADGKFEKKDATVRHTFADAGAKQVTMRVVRDGDVRVAVTKVVLVLPRLPEQPPPPDPEPEPEDEDEDEDAPVVPTPPALPGQPPAPPSGEDSPEVPAEGDEAALMTPFPVIRIAGLLMPWGAKVRLLTVRGPAGATVTVRCKGVGCPLRPFSRRARTGSLRIRSLERRLGAGVRVEIFVRQAGLIGKYTRFRIRGGGRPLKRVDRCLAPGGRRPFRCPSS